MDGPFLPRIEIRGYYKAAHAGAFGLAALEILLAMLDRPILSDIPRQSPEINL